MANEKKYIVTASIELNIRSGPGTDYETVGTVPHGEQIISPDTEGWVPILLEDDTIGWVSSKYLQEAPEEELKSAEPLRFPSDGDPAWIVWAMKQIGIKELPGAGDNPEIISWFELTTLPKEYWHDATAWCAVFVNAGFCLNGVKGLRSARAKDWLGFGRPVEAPEKGDVVVFRWDDGSHHVAYCLALEDDQVRVIGGNQSNAVTETTYPLRNVAGFRRPPRHILAAPKTGPAAQYDFSTKESTIAAIKAECQRQGLDLPTQSAYVLATTEWETGHTFKPVREAYWHDEEWRRRNLSRYYPYYGRGYVQLTWEDNYRKYAEILSIDLVNDPTL
ncbi:MAG: TIGR02594 family protein, partial [Syntrophobacterales bacterium]|nr:TIGR02594 family protein [Syntrophobacterales bacterium]